MKNNPNGFQCAHGHKPYIQYAEFAVGVYPTFAECAQCGIKMKAHWYVEGVGDVVLSKDEIVEIRRFAEMIYDETTNYDWQRVAGSVCAIVNRRLDPDA